jgi:hypothetical protein
LEEKPAKPNETKSDFGSFLRLIQESADGGPKDVDGVTQIVQEPKEKVDILEQPRSERVDISLCMAAEIPKAPPPLADVVEIPSATKMADIPKVHETPVSPDRNEKLMELMQELMTPLVDRWMSRHLAELVSKTVESEIKKALERWSNLL